MERTTDSSEKHPAVRTGIAAAIVVMGVSGSGKSTLARRLGQRLEAMVIEGDEYHSALNVAKMSAGVALLDEDRWPWLDRVAGAIRQATEQNRRVVCACSALKRSYRDRLRAAAKRSLFFVFLQADTRVLESRLRARSEHFMPPSLLKSQLDDLEVPQSDEASLQLSSAGDIDEAVAQVLERLRGLASDHPRN